MPIGDDGSVVQRRHMIPHCCASEIAAILPRVPSIRTCVSFSFASSLSFSPLESTSSSLFVSGSRSRRCLARSPTRLCIQFRGSHETRTLAGGAFNFPNPPSPLRLCTQCVREPRRRLLLSCTSISSSASRSQLRFFNIQRFTSRAFRSSLSLSLSF